MTRHWLLVIAALLASPPATAAQRAPYAAERLVTAAVGYAHPRGPEVLLEAVHIRDQFGDDLNTVRSTADGERGLIPGHPVWNATVNYRIAPLRTTAFITVKNLPDDTFIVARNRGIVPNHPRLVHGGFVVRF